nr:hypothetical protein CFP56_61204 [Quercus suber]
MKSLRPRFLRVGGNEKPFKYSRIVSWHACPQNVYTILRHDHEFLSYVLLHFQLYGDVANASRSLCP